MKHIKSVLLILAAFMTLSFMGCQNDTGKATTLKIVIGNLNARTVFPTIQAENLTDIVLSYKSSGSEDGPTVKTWENYNSVTPVEIQAGFYDFTLSANCGGFNYSGSVDNVTISDGENTLSFDLNLSGITPEDMTGNGRIAHTLTFPDAENKVDHITVTLYQYDENDDLVVAVEAETVELEDNEDGTYKASYVKQVASGEYVMKYKFYSDSAETVCLDEYSTIIYVLKDITSAADESTDRICSVYTVTYELNGAAWTENYTAPVNFSYVNKLILPSAEKLTKPGYTFIKWSTEDNEYGEEITEYNQQKDIKVYAIWQANTDTKYTVKYFLQNIEDDNYTEDITRRNTDCEGTTDTTTYVEAEEITGFTAQEVTQVNIDGNGSSVVNIYYDRIIYTISFELNGGSTETQLDEDNSISGKYGATVTMKNPAKENYTFTGWINESNEEVSLPSTFSEDLRFIAKFSSNGENGSNGATNFSVNFITEDISIEDISVFYGLHSMRVVAEYGYDSYKWIVNGNECEGSDYIDYQLGDSTDFRIQVTAKKNGIRYSSDFIINVYELKFNDLLTMVPVIEEATTIVGDLSDGVFLNGRTVTLSPYSIGKYQVTQKVYEEVMGTNPSYFSYNPADGETQEFRPVECINWYRAIAFCNKLSLKEGYDLCYSVKDNDGNEIDWENLTHDDIPTSSNSNWDAAVCDMTKSGYRLPTEAEWEFAARGGDQNADDWNYYYAGADEISDVAWYCSNSNYKTHEVGTKNSNRLGLYDMSGNVWEWCNDWYDSIDSSETVTDPAGGASGSFRVLRGGGYDDYGCAVANRDYHGPYYCNYDYGFRLARSILR